MERISLEYLKSNNIVKEYINCYLVDKGVRPACLIQFIDYGETSEMNHKSNTILKLLEHHFPALHHLKINQGMLISKSVVQVSDVNTNTKLGNKLGYLCSDTFDRIKEFPSVYYYEYFIILSDKTEVSLFSFMCPSNQYKNTEKIHKLIKPALEPMNYIIKEIKIRKRIEPSIDYFIHKIYLSRLEDKEIESISEILANYGFERLVEPDANGYSIIDFDNAIHKGIVISILTFIKTEIFNTLLEIDITDRKLINEKINLWVTLIIESIIESDKPTAKPSVTSAKPSVTSAKPSAKSAKSSARQTQKNTNRPNSN
jgi:hypothetical protein